MRQVQQYQIPRQGELTIIVTDSGLGGVGVAAEVYRVLKIQGPYSQARIIYYNALFDERSGYNILKSMPQKTAIFDTALHGMLPYRPDVIVLASNTLSVLYPRTAFSQSAGIPVVGLIDLGVNHVLSRIHASPNSAVILFATPVTVREGAFRSQLRRHILDDTRIIEHACPGLEYAIGDGDRATILRLIDQYVAEALQRVPAGISHLFGSLHCTHFGYYQREFTEAFQRQSAEPAEVLNPSTEMANVFTADDCPVVENPDIRIEFVSKVKFHPDGIASLLPYITTIAADVATAFQHYQHKPDLF